jgi:hypothetical protein
VLGSTSQLPARCCNSDRLRQWRSAPLSSANLCSLLSILHRLSPSHIVPSSSQLPGSSCANALSSSFMIKSPASDSGATALRRMALARRRRTSLPSSSYCWRSVCLLLLLLLSCPLYPSGGGDSFYQDCFVYCCSNYPPPSCLKAGLTKYPAV